MKQSYTVSRAITRVYGSQTYIIEAESYEEAAALVYNGGGDFDCEEVEVTELSDECEVWLPDDRGTKLIDGPEAFAAFERARKEASK
jgi:hypothetical protein